MSFTISFVKLDEESGDGIQMGEVNFTSNALRLINRTCKCDLMHEVNMYGDDLFKIATYGIENIANNTEDYLDLESKNGWGTIAQTLVFLRRVRDISYKHRDCMVVVL